MADDDSALAGADADDAVLEDCEIVALKVEMRLVPKWSNVVEKLARHHGERVAVFVLEDELVVKVAIKPENKPGMVRDMNRYWSDFVEQQKREGTWTA